MRVFRNIFHFRTRSRFLISPSPPSACLPLCESSVHSAEKRHSLSCFYHKHLSFLKYTTIGILIVNYCVVLRWNYSRIMQVFATPFCSAPKTKWAKTHWIPSASRMGKCEKMGEKKVNSSQIHFHHHYVSQSVLNKRINENSVRECIMLRALSNL